jgi:hypothetical protein
MAMKVINAINGHGRTTCFPRQKRLRRVWIYSKRRSALNFWERGSYALHYEYAQYFRTKSSSWYRIHVRFRARFTDRRRSVYRTRIVDDPTCCSPVVAVVAKAFSSAPNAITLLLIILLPSAVVIIASVALRITREPFRFARKLFFSGQRVTIVGHTRTKTTRLSLAAH